LKSDDPFLTSIKRKFQDMSRSTDTMRIVAESEIA